MARRKQPQRIPDRPGYPRRDVLALIGAASLSMLGCDEKPRPQPEPVVSSEPVEPPTPVMSAEKTEPEAESASAQPATTITKRLPSKGHRSVSITHFETVHYALTLEHDHPGFGEYVDQNSDTLLLAADAAIRIVPPYGYRNDAARARTEEKISEKIGEEFAKKGHIDEPLATVKLEVRNIDRRIRRPPGLITPMRDPP